MVSLVLFIPVIGAALMSASQPERGVRFSIFSGFSAGLAG
jgi:hypothetical protein